MLTIRDVDKLLSVEKIESENKFFNTLTSTVSHEMMTPLNCIITFGRSLLNSQFKAKAKVICDWRLQSVSHLQKHLLLKCL